LKDAYYFSHDSNAFQDPKVTKMIMELGMESYGIYWVIIENLRNEEEYKLHADDMTTIAFQCRCDQAKVKQIVTKYKLFVLSPTGHFYSKSLNLRMEIMDILREKRQEAGRLGGIASSKARAIVDRGSSSKVKESKVKEKKVNEIKETRGFTPPNVPQISSYIKEKGYSVDPELFHNHYSSNGWKVGGRAAMKDWEAAVRTWEKRGKKDSAAGQGGSVMGSNDTDKYLESLNNQ